MQLVLRLLYSVVDDSEVAVDSLVVQHLELAQGPSDCMAVVDFPLEELAVVSAHSADLEELAVRLALVSEILDLDTKHCATLSSRYLLPQEDLNSFLMVCYVLVGVFILILLLLGTSVPCHPLSNCET